MMTEQGRRTLRTGTPTTPGGDCCATPPVPSNTSLASGGPRLLTPAQDPKEPEANKVCHLDNGAPARHDSLGRYRHDRGPRPEHQQAEHRGGRRRGPEPHPRVPYAPLRGKVVPFRLLSVSGEPRRRAQPRICSSVCVPMCRTLLPAQLPTHRFSRVRGWVPGATVRHARRRFPQQLAHPTPRPEPRGAPAGVRPSRVRAVRQAIFFAR